MKLTRIRKKIERNQIDTYKKVVLESTVGLIALNMSNVVGSEVCNVSEWHDSEAGNDQQLCHFHVQFDYSDERRIDSDDSPDTKEDGEPRGHGFED